mmetsp:Transcript_21924/g.64741  ORF Transcript_21924/g.64741 Transcript_21924/m.64741 type:complete len:158 (+) Transcript_21924:65-538(+)
MYESKLRIIITGKLQSTQKETYILRHSKMCSSCNFVFDPLGFKCSVDYIHQGVISSFLLFQPSSPTIGMMCFAIDPNYMSAMQSMARTRRDSLLSPLLASASAAAVFSCLSVGKSMKKGFPAIIMLEVGGSTIFGDCGGNGSRGNDSGSGGNDDDAG